MRFKTTVEDGERQQQWHAMYCSTYEWLQQEIVMSMQMLYTCNSICRWRWHYC